MNPHKLQRRHRKMLKRMLRERGHHFEAESRDQLRESIAGHADGIILTVPDDINLLTPAPWEHKALNAKNFRAVEGDGLAKVFPRYAGQVSIYQHFLEVFNPALMTIVDSDTCERLHFTVPFDPRLAQEAIDRAVDLVRATRDASVTSDGSRRHE